MQTDPDHIAYLLELLSGLGPVSARRMFGGHGIYHDGLMIAVVVEQRPYLKVDDLTRADFAAAGCEVWTYGGKGKPIEMGYWSVPDEAMDSAEAMTPWARRAYAAALRKANAPRPAKKPLAAKKAAAKKPAAATKKATAAKKAATVKKPAAAKKSGVAKQSGTARQSGTLRKTGAAKKPGPAA
ncbi:TfoX/Sxy family protein [Tahibacter harae]|uniref:TfoX/Sxy family protein n=1 Tax=Tahibacter harae TaxID=2963937 RepID=A0ABT1QT44_9GAMM|nr:TfoX/Sxy family protein [Tahibacter harae]MCQ4165441.1 TfoX/Sxy family protein [Tahibacter harae]